MVARRGSRQLRAPRVSRSDGLLSRFIREKLAQHVEPARQGTPRGAPVGFSRKKLAAALGALTSADVQQTAREVGVSYGVVRKWRTEAPFKALVERLEDEFVEDFCATVDADLGVRGPLRGATVPEEADLDQVADALHESRARWIAANLGDAARYGSRVSGKLTEHLLDQREGVGRPWRMSVLQALLTLWPHAGPDTDPGQIGAGLDASQSGSRALLGMLRFIVLTLDSGLSEGHRRLAQAYLRILHRQIVGRPP